MSSQAIRTFATQSNMSETKLIKMEICQARKNSKKNLLIFLFLIYSIISFFIILDFVRKLFYAYLINV